MEALERMFEDSEDEVTTAEADTEVSVTEVDTETAELKEDNGKKITTDSAVKLVKRILKRYSDSNRDDDELTEDDDDDNKDEQYEDLLELFTEEQLENLEEMTEEDIKSVIESSAQYEDSEDLDEAVRKIKKFKEIVRDAGGMAAYKKKRLSDNKEYAKKSATWKAQRSKDAKKNREKSRVTKTVRTAHYDPTDDVNALIGDTELSEEFKTKASTIFEAAVNREVESQVGDQDLVLEELLTKCAIELEEEMAQEVDKYLNYVVEEWIEENKLAIESGIQNELSENFMTGLRKLFTENYVDIPETKVDIVSELANKVQELEADLEAKLTENIELKESLGDLKRDDLIRSISGDLVETEIEKMKELSTGVDYTGDDEEFIANVQTLKESYFPKGKVNSPVSETDTVQEVDYENLSDSMAAYTNALSRVLK